MRKKKPPSVGKSLSVLERAAKIPVLCLRFTAMDTVQRVTLFCRREHLFLSARGALVMCSGGQDSLALLHLLASGGLGADGPARVSVLHVNHHLRGPESDADQALVEGICSRLGVPLRVEHRPLKKGAGNLQEQARLARREAAHAVSSQVGAGVVVLGHTLDDQAETLLYRACRYGGLRSLRGMMPKEGPWVRPFLCVRRSETEAYCVGHGLTFAVDRGNDDPGYARTGIRARVLPLLEELLPGAAEALARTAEVAAEASAVTGDAVERARDEVSAGGVFSAPRLLGLPMPLRRALLHRLLEEVAGRGVSRRVVLDTEALLEVEGSASLDVGSGYVVCKEYDEVLLTPREDEAVARMAAWAASVTLPVPGEVEAHGLRLRARIVAGYEAHDPRTEAYLDADSVVSSLTVRGVRPGDRMQPLGMSGSRLLKDILVDRAVPARGRPRVPVFVSAGRVVWLGGVVVAESSRISERTKRFLRLSIEKVAEPGVSRQANGRGAG